MARIRSVHPALFTDEAWVGCSAFARLLIVGLWTDADDQGVFEWKPVSLKMKLLPNDAVDVVGLLDELADADIIREFEDGGRRYGAIKNFQKYQRPKKPNAVHPLPTALARYVGKGAKAAGSGGETVDADTVEVPTLFRTGGEPVGNQAATSGEKSPQMEDGGGREGDRSPPTPPSEGREDFGTEIVEQAIAAYPDTGKAHTKPASVVKAWPAIAEAAGGDLQLLACIVAYAAAVRPGDAVPSLQKWLADGRWKMFLSATLDVDDHRQAWPGPSAVWDEVVKHADKHLPLRGGTGAEYAASWLLPQGWRDVPSRAVVCNTGIAAERLRRDCGGVFRRLDVEVIHQRVTEAAA